MDLGHLQNILNHSWSAETAKGEWRKDVPSLNQCAITALVVQDIFGGDLLRCPMTNGDSHYWNRLPDGTEVDLTEEQFGFIEARPIKEDTVVRQRDYVLSFPDTLRRYHLLKKLVGEYLIP
jgi:hypothetical protein